MDVAFYLIGASLFLLGILLTVLAYRGIAKYVAAHVRSQLMWGSGLAIGAAAMYVEGIVYFGVVNSALLQAYVFFSAAIVGVLSLGATKILKSPRLEAAYTWYTVATCGVVAFFSAITPMPTSMVTAGIITGNPPVLLLALSSLVTVPATVLLLATSGLSLRKSWRWQTLLMVAGAVILGAGGTLYIASVPVALYYGEFLGILLLFLGLISLPQTAPTAAPAGRSAGSA